MMLQKVSPRATRIRNRLPGLVKWHACFDVGTKAEQLPVFWIVLKKLKNIYVQSHIDADSSVHRRNKYHRCLIITIIIIIIRIFKPGFYNWVAEFHRVAGAAINVLYNCCISHFGMHCLRNGSDLHT